MRPGLVSIMMPAFNAGRFIVQAIDSTLAQDYAAWELIVVDDGSTDNTSQLVRQYVDPRIQLINQKNAGEAAARNTALSRMQGEFIAFLDADDVHLPHHLEAAVGHLRRRPDRDGVYTDGYHIDQDGVRLKSLASRRSGPHEGWVFDQTVRASDVFGSPSCVVLRREPVVRHRLEFDTRITIGPDWDFFTRYAEFGQFGYIDAATCLYRIHPGSVTLQTDNEKRRLSLAVCRENAIKLAGFSRCSPETRVYAFYDLLMSLSAHDQHRQAEITAWPEFHGLPVNEQARLFRLLASQAILNNGLPERITDWLGQARHLNPCDRKSRILSTLYRLNPRLCSVLLRARALTQQRDDSPPFADLPLRNDAHSHIS